MRLRELQRYLIVVSKYALIWLISYLLVFIFLPSLRVLSLRGFLSGFYVPSEALEFAQEVVLLYLPPLLLGLLLQSTATLVRNLTVQVVIGYLGFLILAIAVITLVSRSLRLAPPELSITLQTVCVVTVTLLMLSSLRYPLAEAKPMLLVIVSLLLLAPIAHMLTPSAVELMLYPVIAGTTAYTAATYTQRQVSSRERRRAALRAGLAAGVLVLVVLSYTQYIRPVISMSPKLSPVLSLFDIVFIIVCLLLVMTIITCCVRAVSLSLSEVAHLLEQRLIVPESEQGLEDPLIKSAYKVYHDFVIGGDKKSLLVFLLSHSRPEVLSEAKLSQVLDLVLKYEDEPVPLLAPSWLRQVYLLRNLARRAAILRAIVDILLGRECRLETVREIARTLSVKSRVLTLLDRASKILFILALALAVLMAYLGLTRGAELQLLVNLAEAVVVLAVISSMVYDLTRSIIERAVSEVREVCT